MEIAVEKELRKRSNIQFKNATRGIFKLYREEKANLFAFVRNLKTAAIFREHAKW